MASLGWVGFAFMLATESFSVLISAVLLSVIYSTFSLIFTISYFEKKAQKRMNDEKDISMITPNASQVIGAITPLRNYNNHLSQSVDKKDIFNNNNMNDIGIFNDQIDTVDLNDNIHISDINTNGNTMDYGVVNANDKPIIKTNENMNENMIVSFSCVAKHNHIAYKLSTMSN